MIKPQNKTREKGIKIHTHIRTANNKTTVFGQPHDYILSGVVKILLKRHNHPIYLTIDGPN